MSKVMHTGALFAAIISAVAGHTSVEEFEAGGKTYPGFRAASKQDPGNGSPAWLTNQGWGYQPVMGSKLNHPDIIAHVDASPSQHTADVDAGSEVTFHWHHTGQCKGNENGWDCSHHGWTSTYLAACNGDCKDVDKTKLEFFKIHESALIDYRPGRYSEAARPEEQTGYWATDKIFYDNNNAQSVTIPKGIPSGNYVLRTEVASIHNNEGLSAIQFWPQAFNIKVNKGDDSAKVPAGKKGTELYSADHEDLFKFDLYNHEAGKTFSAAPGPPLASIATVSRRSHARDFSA